jgi:extracellular factor (EF) 3-hydroxypalmitic acid methyl ester biosynthesis protein
VYPQTQIDPVVSFLNAQGEAVRGTIVTLQRKALVMEVYNPHSIVQVSEVMNALSIRVGASDAYVGKAVVISLVNTGLTAVVSLRLIDEWRELTMVELPPAAVGRAALDFVRDWDERFRIRRDYQIAVNETRSYLAEVARWVEQVDLSAALPKDQDGRLRRDVFDQLSAPLTARIRRYLDDINGEAAQVSEEQAVVHRAFAQASLHPLVLRAPFVFRTFTKPLCFAGDYQMVNQLLDDPRQGPSTYFQIVNAAFLATPVAQAHRNRIDMLVAFLCGQADAARAVGRPYRVLNIGCGPAVEVQRFLQEYAEPHWLEFELVDFSAETLDWTRSRLAALNARLPRPATIAYVNDSVHRLLKRRLDDGAGEGDVDTVYCAGLFDYLSDKVCAKLLNYFASRMRGHGKVLITNVHEANPGRHAMEHLLEWYLIYRDEARMRRLLPSDALNPQVYLDATGVNVFAEAILP